jgi:hypothetical protein
MIPATGSREILQENTGNRWNMKAVFRLEIVRIFSGEFLSTSCAFRKEPAGNHWKKSENFPAGILLPQNHRNFPEPAVSGPGCSTWDAIRKGNSELEPVHLTGFSPVLHDQLLVVRKTFLFDISV